MKPESAPIRLVIVEDDDHLLAALAQIMDSQPDITVVGAHASTEEAMEATDWREVDVLLADLSLPGVSGVDLIAAATYQNTQIFALVHTVHDDRESLFAALRAGAIGYVIKGLPALEAIEAVRAVSQGASSLSPSIAHFLIEEFHRYNFSSVEEALTPREVKLLNLSIQGLLYKEISDQLSISPGTVHSHIKRIYRKLQASSREQALERAQTLGYLQPRDDRESGSGTQ